MYGYKNVLENVNKQLNYLFKKTKSKNFLDWDSNPHPPWRTELTGFEIRVADKTENR